jgi:hypothetical protein
VWRDGFSECEPEYEAFYECVSEQVAFSFDCTQSFPLARPQACSVEYSTLWYCERAEGQDCRREPALDQSCAVGTPKPPNYT